MIRHFGHPLNLPKILSRNRLKPSLTALRKIVWDKYLSNNIVHEKKRGKISDMRLSWNYDINFTDSNFSSDFNQTNDVNNLTMLINNTIEDEENEQ
uniref:Uncharacterized protein n=1 Tax=Strongyloides venezuelensis TaxID=75913 RepID=A0A0K0G5M2_STRVS